MMFLKNDEVVNNSIMPFTRRGIQQKLSAGPKLLFLGPKTTTEYNISDNNHNKVNSKGFSGVSVCMLLLLPFLHRY